MSCRSKNQPIFKSQYHNRAALHAVNQQIPVKSGNSEHAINQTIHQPDYHRAPADHSAEQSNGSGANLLSSLTNQVANSNIHQTSCNYSPVVNFYVVGNQFSLKGLLSHPQVIKFSASLPVSVPACSANGSEPEYPSSSGNDAGDDVHINANQKLEPKHRQRKVSFWDATQGKRVTQAEESDSESYYDPLDTDAHLSHTSSAKLQRSPGLHRSGSLKNLKHENNGAEFSVRANATADAGQTASAFENLSKPQLRPSRPSTLRQDTSPKDSHPHSHSDKPNLEAKADASQTGGAPGSSAKTFKPDNSGFPVHPIASKSSDTKQYPSSQKENNVPKQESNFRPDPSASSSSTLPFKPPLNLGDSETNDDCPYPSSSSAGTLLRRSTRNRNPPRNLTEESIAQAAADQTLCTSTTTSPRRSARIQKLQERKGQLEKLK